MGIMPQNNLPERKFLCPFYFVFGLGLLVLAPSLAHSAVLDIPGNGTKLSGIGVISGWKCEAEGDITVSFNEDDPIPLVYGSERPDVLEAGACGSADVGFVAIWNWGELGDGTHTAVVYDNGVRVRQEYMSKVTTLRGAVCARGERP